MYWPIGTPRIFATSSRSGPAFNLVVSHDGLPNPFDNRPADEPSATSYLDSQLQRPQHDEIEPATPLTPVTPAIQSVDYDAHDSETSRPSPRPNANIPLKDPVLALRISRPGHLFAVITSTSMTIWQAKVSSLAGCPVLSHEPCSFPSSPQSS